MVRWLSRMPISVLAKRAGAMFAVAIALLTASAVSGPKGGSVFSLGVPPAEAHTNTPGCIRPDVARGPAGAAHIRITNNCRKTKKVKAVIRRFPDSKCLRIPPGQSRDYAFWGDPFNYHGLHGCR